MDKLDEKALNKASAYYQVVSSQVQRGFCILAAPWAGASIGRF